MPALNERATEALEAEEASGLAAALQGIRSPTETPKEPVSPTGASLKLQGRTIVLPAAAADAVLDLLRRLAEGHSVVVASTDALLTTSQAAELLGISATYLLRQANNGVIPVQYRGTHRRFALADALHYLEESKRVAAAKAATTTPAVKTTT